MKQFWIFALIVALPLGVFAQGRGIDWKPGTSVTREYKELAGTVVLNDRAVPMLKVGSDEYGLMVGRRDPALLALKNGAAATVKGIATTIVVSGQPSRLVFRPFEATVDGKTVTFERHVRGWKNRGAAPAVPAPDKL